AVEEAAARVVATREAVEEAAGKKAVARATVKEVIARVISARGRQREESRGRDEPGNNNETKRVRRKWLVRGKQPAGT
ncbi:MAG: hypothetical protein LBF09_00730, partial [Odoribacteraceae bacterium]|nr:hypothetical protein [Odoribacteraceae bacterium]